MISVVTITFNNFLELRESLQDLPAVESIVINGGACQETRDFLKTYKGISISEADKGISDAFSKGARLATTPYIAFLNSGDRLIDKTYYAEAATFLDQHPDYDFIYSDYAFDDVEAGRIHIPAARCPLGRGMPFPHPTMVVRRSVFERVGYFSLSYRVAMDFDLVVRMMKAQMKGHYISRPTVLMEGTGLSSSQELKGILECGRSLREHGMMSFENLFFFYQRLTLWALRHYLPLGFLKKLKYRKA